MTHFKTLGVKICEENAYIKFSGLVTGIKSISLLVLFVFTKALGGEENSKYTENSQDWMRNKIAASH